MADTNDKASGGRHDAAPARSDAAEAGAPREPDGCRSCRTVIRPERMGDASCRDAAPDFGWDESATAISARSRRHLEEIASMLGLSVEFFFRPDRGQAEAVRLPPVIVSRIIDLIFELPDLDSKEERDKAIRYIIDISGRKFDN